MAASPRATPKRKREPPTTAKAQAQAPTPIVTNSKFVFDFGGDDGRPGEDGSSSPRSRVAHKFRGLALEGGGGGGVSSASSAADSSDHHHHHCPSEDEHDRRDTGKSRLIGDPLDDEDDDWANADMGTGAGADAEADAEEILTMRKRQKVPDVVMQHADSAVNPPAQQPAHRATAPIPVPEPEPNLDRQSRVSKPRARKRRGTPPLSSTKNPPGLRANTLSSSASADGNPESESDSDSDPVEPIRASLTWQEDEITVFDPNDEDDDGTGINGIGFKPSPATAYARDQKRRRQLAEYRKREESEARARRQQRRRGGSPPGLGVAGGGVKKADHHSSPGRRVRFMDPEPAAAAVAAAAAAGAVMTKG